MKVSECRVEVCIENGTAVLKLATHDGIFKVPFPPGEARSVGQALIDAETIIERLSDD